MKKNTNYMLPGQTGVGRSELLTVREVTEAWRACQDQISQIQRQQDELFVKDGDNIDALYDLESRRGALKEHAEGLLRRLIDMPSASTRDVAAKLSLWRDVTCPADTPFNRKTTIDFVVVSALHDLEKLAS